jgi:beta-glucanase (GH16 family)
MYEKLNPRSVATSETPVPIGEGRGVRHRSNASKEFYASKPFILDANVQAWQFEDAGTEPDDDLHDPFRELKSSSSFSPSRGILNLGTLIILAAGILALFAGYPIISWFTKIHDGTKGGYNLGGANATGQVAALPPGMRSDLIDADTPSTAYTRTGFDGNTYDLVFSDEFEVDGRSFYPGDDPYWEAVDLWYWGTGDYEWYDPAAVTTRDGALQITLSQTVEHNLNFRSGMIQSWNKFCFTGGYIEVSLRLPGSPTVSGLWPAIWTMGNLGRAGYGASLEGTWPYSYENCDVGTLQNQTDVNGNPVAAQTGGDVGFNRKHNTKALSFLGGQRLSACTCPSDYPELHPGPKLPDGTLKGRSAPEIDVLEAQISNGRLSVSQSAQFAPYNQYYIPSNTTGPAYTLYQSTTEHNGYTGEVTQQSASAVTAASQTAVQYDGEPGTYATYGFEYSPGSDGYVEWVSNGRPAWRLNKAFLDPDPVSGISSRVIPQEPMYIIMNMGLSQNFAPPEWDKMADMWPFIMSVDYVRVYQPRGQLNIGCDPPDYPTYDFINRHMATYTNANLTIWGGTAEQGGYQANWPRNRLNPNGCNAEPQPYPGSPTNPKPQAPFYPKSEIGNNGY